jgi:N-acetylglucosamine-6-phosphate deacetylase
MWDVGAALVRYGVTGYLPTIVSSPETTIDRALAALAARPPGYQGAEPLGLHLEGPLLNPARRGAHAMTRLRTPDAAVVDRWTRTAGVALVTLAPELPGAVELIGRLVNAGVVVAAGHTEASTQQMVTAVDAGLRYVTHLFNAMAPLVHREPGPVGVALVDDRLTVGLIADGIHVHPLAVTLAWRALGPERCSLVTDAVAPLGRPHGRYLLGDVEVHATSDGVRLADGTLAGSDLSLDRAVQNLVAFTGCESHEALATVTSTPARLLGLSGKGVVAAGHDADLVLLRPDLTVAATLVAGRLVHDAREPAWRS